ncbi:MAG: oxalate:formate antiporter [Ruminococcus sp.]|nr:oxalate:formate antiporter [Ruminococcus sp.]
MKNTAKILPCYAADTSGVCSALYELGGMTVVHDASGCNSTYSTHDEPRWYDRPSKIYISALTEMDAVMGNDEKLISDTVETALSQRPEFIALCGSPMPMMTGVDFDALAAEIEARSGIKTLPLHTNGTKSYLDGAGEAFEAIVREFVSGCDKAKGIGVNVLGATPLDLPSLESAQSIKTWLRESGFEQVCSLAMGSTLDEVRRAASARVSLVLSQSGIPAAKLLKKRFGIPYVCGLPVGKEFSAEIARSLYLAANEGCCLYPCLERKSDPEGILCVGEAVTAGSFAAAVSKETLHGARVAVTLECDGELLGQDDKLLTAEEDIEKELCGSCEGALGDPMFGYLMPREKELYSLPHFAMSGRCYQRSMRDVICAPQDKLLEEIKLPYGRAEGKN